MTKDHANSAYRGLPVPADIPKEERAAYVMLRELYRLHREGELSIDTAKVLKNPLMNFRAAPPMEQASALTFFSVNTLWRMESGDADAADGLQLMLEEFGNLLIRVMEGKR